MSEAVYNKLVRDNIPTIIKSNGETPVTRTLEAQEYRRRLLEKLVEEAQELLESDGSISERADVAEVLLAIDTAFNVDQPALEEVREAKVRARGAFAMRTYLEKVISPE
jgi:predicted house-cleaning noncanonical NTP pyrophosphatase (MazG superfamily)